jgi:thioredoxin 1
MPVHQATDSELRRLIFQHPKVVVKFTKTDCPICERMGITYEKLSAEPRFQDITFLLMDASESPVSSQEVLLTGTPFFAIYENSMLTQCKLVSDEEALRNLLEHLY